MIQSWAVQQFQSSSWLLARPTAHKDEHFRYEELLAGNSCCVEFPSKSASLSPIHPISEKEELRDSMSGGFKLKDITFLSAKAFDHDARVWYWGRMGIVFAVVLSGVEPVTWQFSEHCRVVRSACTRQLGSRTPLPVTIKRAFSHREFKLSAVMEWEAEIPEVAWRDFHPTEWLVSQLAKITELYRRAHMYRHIWAVERLRDLLKIQIKRLYYTSSSTVRVRRRT